MRILPFLLPFLLPLGLLSGQPAPAPALQIARATSAIQVDGVLDEPAWQSAQTASGFRLNFPVDTGYSRYPTEVRLAFDDRHLHIAAVCYQRPEDYTVQSLRRDFAAGTSDMFNVVIDPSKDGLNGFLFGVSPLNVQREALIDNGGTESFEWDNKWSAAVQSLPDRWVVEMSIPFSTLRYSVADGPNTWRFNFVRTKLKDWEVSTWQPVPLQYGANNLAFAGEVTWEQPPPRRRLPVSLIPYAIAGYSVDYQRDPSSQEVRARPDDWKANLGGDAKVGLTPSLNLDLTINPDFSQVEVDRQVANLSRFELFFPERRQFFLENRDLFAMFGFPNTRPFFSRRIGLARNPRTGLNETVPILAGARLSGKLNDNWRVGLLNMQTGRVDWDSVSALPAANFTVATLSRKVFARSAVSAIFVGKENFLGALTDEQLQGQQPWNRVAGLEYNLYSKDNRWEGEWYYHRSFSPDPARRGETFAHFLGYFDRHWQARLGYQYVGKGYDSESGFVPRNAFQSGFPGVSYTVYFPGHRFLNLMRFGVEGDLTFDLDLKETDRDAGLYVQAGFKDQSSVQIGLYNAYTYLFGNFNPTNIHKPGQVDLPGLRGYTYSGLRGEFNSSTAHDWQGSVAFTAGEFFNGRRFNLEGELGYRWQPYGTFGLGYSYNRIRLPEPYASADFWLLGPRAELAFSRNLFLSAFFQYNTQANNFNINTRLQWRFAPVSDLFFVYTDNSFAEPVPQTSVRFFAPKNKALVLKVVYWLNV
jgi:hypothetical protein